MGKRRASHPLRPLRPLHGEVPRAPHPFPLLLPLHGEVPRAPHPPLPLRPCTGKRRVPRAPRPPLRPLHGERRVPARLQPRALHCFSPIPGLPSATVRAGHSPFPAQRRRFLMFRTDRGTVVAACLMSALGCLMACALLGFPATGGVRFAWVLLWATASVAGMRFLRAGPPRKGVLRYVRRAVRAGAGAGLPAGHRGQTGIEGLLLSLGTALCLGPRRRLGRPVADEHMAALVPPPKRDPATARPKARPPRSRPKAPPPRPRPKARPRTRAPKRDPEPARPKARPRDRAPKRDPRDRAPKRDPRDRVPQSATPRPRAPKHQPQTRAPKPRNRRAPRPRHPLLAPMVLMLVAWTPLLLAFYPGIHAYDTFRSCPTIWRVSSARITRCCIRS